MREAVGLNESAHAPVDLEPDGLVEHRRIADREHEREARKAYDREHRVHPSLKFDMAKA